jgi:hypothetical protein
LGGRKVFSTPVDQIMIGPAEPKWDLAAIMFFPTRNAFLEMLGDADFQAASRHRKAALANHYLLHLAGERLVEVIIQQGPMHIVQYGSVPSAL